MPKIKTAIASGLLLLVVVALFIIAIVRSSNFTTKDTKPVTVAQLQKKLASKENQTTAEPSELVTPPVDPKPDSKPSTPSSPPAPVDTLDKTGPGSVAILYVGSSLIAGLLFEARFMLKGNKL